MHPVSPVIPSRPDLHELELAKDQAEYLTLPVIVGGTPYGILTSRWKLTWRERLRVLIGGNLWLQLWTWGGPAQPVRPTVDEPTIEGLVIAQRDLARANNWAGEVAALPPPCE